MIVGIQFQFTFGTLVLEGFPDMLCCNKGSECCLMKNVVIWTSSLESSDIRGHWRFNWLVLLSFFIMLTFEDLYCIMMAHPVFMAFLTWRGGTKFNRQINLYFFDCSVFPSLSFTIRIRSIESIFTWQVQLIGILYWFNLKAFRA